MDDKSGTDLFIEKVEEYFSDPKNVEDFKNYLDEEMKKPYMTQLQCNCMWCEYNAPEDADMGTITYCTRYEDTKENKYICKEREWYEW